jgi:hypothetical protein
MIDIFLILTRYVLTEACGVECVGGVYRMGFLRQPIL